MSNPTPDVGPKTQEALDALDDAIDKVQAFHEDDDENDAAPIWERVRRLQEKLAAASSGASHLPKDALTGFPVDPSTSPDLGPASPVTDPSVTPEEAGQAQPAPEGTPNQAENAGDGTAADDSGSHQA